MQKCWTVFGVGVIGMVLMLGLCARAHGGAVVAVSDVFGHNEKANYNGVIGDMINGSGMNGIGNDGDPGWPEGHGGPAMWTATSTAYQDEWVSGDLLDDESPVNGIVGWTIFDLGAVVTNLESLYIWNVRNDGDAYAASFNVHVAEVPTVPVSHGPTGSTSIDYDFSSGGWTLINTGGALTGSFQGDQVVDLTGNDGRYVAVEFLTNGGDANRVGLAEVGVTSVDTTPPSISILSPTNGTIQVPTHTDLVITFDEAIATNTGNVTITNLTDSTRTVIAMGDPQISVSGADLVIDQSSFMDLGDTYAVLLDNAAVSDLSSNAFVGISSTSTWQFTTTPLVSPAAEVSAATDIFVIRATLNAMLSAGGEADAYLVWDASIPGTPDTTGSWDNVESFGLVSQGALLSTNLTTLSVATTYYYRLYVTNTSGSAWSSVTNFAMAAATNTITGTAGSALYGTRDSWNNDNNWSHGFIARETQSAVIADGLTAWAWNNDTPMYTGDFVIGNNALLHIGWTTVRVGSYNCLGTPGSTALTMHDGSHINMRMGSTPQFPEIQLMGDAQITLGSSTQPSADPTFGHGIFGPHTLTLSGKGGGDYYLTTSNDFAVLTTDSGAGTGYTIRGQAADSLPKTVTITHNGSGTMTATLYIDADDAMPDDGVLSINGADATKLNMNANDTIYQLFFDGTQMPGGDYTIADGWIAGTGTLTVIDNPVYITNNVAVNLTDTTADLTGTLDATQDVFNVYVYWSLNDNADASAWLGDAAASNMLIGAFGDLATVTGSVASLTPSTTYFYTMFASNAVETLWASPNASFFTPGTAASPVVTTAGGEDAVGLGSATLRGELTAGGSAQAFICWGTTDGGTGSTGDWANVSAALAVIDGVPFTHDVSGLLYGIAYNYRVYASNGMGEAWSDVDVFTTLAPESSLGLPVMDSLELWLDANDLDGSGDGGDGDPAVGANIVTWVDKSGNVPSRDATDLLSDPAVADGPNGTRVIRFDNGDRIATTHSFTPAQYTIFGVSRYAGAAKNRVISSRDTNWLFGHHGGVDERFYANGWIHDAGSNNENWHIYMGHINDDADPKATFAKDGAVLVTDSTGSSNGDYMPKQLQLNGYNGGSELSDSEIAEVIIYNRVLDTNELEQVGGYLASKYGLSTAYPPAAPSAGVAMANTHATNIAATTAELVGSLDATQSVFTVSAYYSTNNNADAAAWLADGDAASVEVGTYTNAVGQSVVASVSSLVGGSTYYYTMLAANAATNIWAAPNLSFFVDRAPVLVTLSPANGAINVVPVVDLSATFDEAIVLSNGGVIALSNLTSGATTTITLPDAQVSVSGDTTLAINPSSNLLAGNTYAVLLGTNTLSDTNGNVHAGIADTNTWVFTVATAEAVAPVIASLSPSNTATEVTVATDLMIGFDEYVALIDGGVITLSNVTAGAVTTITLPDAGVSADDTTITINPASDLAFGSTYVVRIGTNVAADVWGNIFAGISDDTTWQFMTESAPAIIALGPANNATNVALGANLVATFNKDVVLSGGGNVTLKNLTEGNATTITLPDGRVSVAGAVVTINPSVDFGLGDQYAVQIGANAIADLNGNAFVGISDDATWTFTVQEPVVTIYIGPNTSNNDRWNLVTSWSNDIPDGAMSAIIPAGKLATAWDDNTPTYTGDLTIGTNAQVGIGWTTVRVGSYNALGTPGFTTIHMYDGAHINTRMGSTPTIPKIQLHGNASFTLGSSTQPSADPTFGHGIHGPYSFTLLGKGGGDYYLTTSNSVDGLVADPLFGNNFNIHANATGSLGSGDVTIPPNPGNNTLTANLIVNAADAMADTATVTLNGPASITKLTMNADDTISALVIDGVRQIVGTYGASGNTNVDYQVSWLAGSGILTIPVPPADYWDLNGAIAGSGSATPDGVWNEFNTSWNTNAAGMGVTSNRTPNLAAVFSAGDDATGSYTVSVSGTQDVGGLTFDDGAVMVSGGSLRVTSDAFMNVASGRVASVASVIVDDGSDRLLTKVGSGALWLQGTNTYPGVTRIEDGVLAVAALADAGVPSALGAYAAAGAGGVELVNGTLRYTGASTTVNRGLTLKGSTGTLDVSSPGVTLAIGESECADFSGTLSMTGASGSRLDMARITLVEGVNLTLNPTGLVVSVASVLGATSYPLGAPTFTLSGVTTGNVVVGEITRINPPGSPFTRDLNLAKSGLGEWTVQGGVNFGAGKVTVNDGVLALRGSSSYSGVTTINGGTVVVGTNAPHNANGAFGRATSEVVLGVAGGNNDAVILIDGPHTVGRAIVLPSSDAVDVGTRTLMLGGNAATNATFSGDITLGTDNRAGRDLTLTAAAGGRVSFSGSIQDPTGMDPSTNLFVKIGTGTAVLAGSNTFTGDVLVNVGTLSLEASHTLPDDGALWIEPGASLDLAAGVNETVFSLYMDGAPASRGTWGSSASAAGAKNDVYFSGTGILTVQDGPWRGFMLYVR
jgi:autotransporter-associated beta strand protein